MRKLEGIVKEKYDVVIIDVIGSEWLKYCFPKECNSFSVRIDNKLPFIKSFSFFYNLLRCIAKYGLTSVALLSAIILELKPKVVITFIDNNRFMGPMQTIFPSVLFISVQNGTRLGDPSFKSRGKYLSFPYYFGLGDHEFNMMIDKNATVKRYYSTGSLKMGIFLSTIYSPTKKRNKAKDICFVSPYSIRLANSSDSNCIKFMALNQEFCRNLLKFSQNNNINIVIAMRNELKSDEYQSEMDFFENIFGRDGAIYCANDRVKMSSYKTGIESSLIVSVISTLLYELLGVKKKILCINFAKDMENDERQYDAVAAGVVNDERQYEFLPSEILLNSLDYGEFNNKVNALLEMSDNDFSEKTKYARKCYMNFGDKYPHEIIYNLIKNKCNK
jgi:surface carbohydrate biosynthesis protein